MKFFFVTFILIFFYANSQAGDSTLFSCKYRYTFQKDSGMLSPKYNDIMILTISENFTIYYSYLKQFGARKLEKDVSNNSDGINVSGNLVSIDASKRRESYFMQNESEIIEINFLNKSINVSDQLMLTNYGYKDKLEIPTWNIGFVTQTILGQKCQIATTTFKGRNYTAWFSTKIHLPYGPWFLNGLPGLIMKVSDEKEQFVFECIELNTSNNDLKVFKPYTNIMLISKKTLRKNKKLFIQNPLEYVTGIEGKVVNVTDANGQTISMPRKQNKPYNPIDLTQ